jgi:hypothetical protein
MLKQKSERLWLSLGLSDKPRVKIDRFKVFINNNLLHLCAFFKKSLESNSRERMFPPPNAKFGAEKKATR